MKRALDAGSWFFGLLSGVGIVALILLTTADVSWRNIQGRSIPGAYEYTEVILVTTVFLSLAWTQRTDGHVSIDLVTRVLPPRVRHIVQASGLAIAILVLGWMVVATGQAAWQSFLTGEYRFGLARVPVWPARVAVCIGTGLLVAQLILHFRSELKRAVSGEETGAEKPGGQGRAD